MDLVTPFISTLFPHSQSVVARMNEACKKPEIECPGMDQSELLVVAGLKPDGHLCMHDSLARFKISDDSWIDAKTQAPIKMEITHWILARDHQMLA